MIIVVFLLLGCSEVERRRSLDRVDVIERLGQRWQKAEAMRPFLEFEE